MRNEKLIRLALLGGAAATALVAAGPGNAQDAPPVADEQAPEADVAPGEVAPASEEYQRDDIVVTGTLSAIEARLAPVSGNARICTTGRSSPAYSLQ